MEDLSRVYLDMYEGYELDEAREEVDLYDLVLDYLLDEGFCDDVDAGEVIMAHMSEEWREEILNEVKGMGYVHPTRPDPSRGMSLSPAIKASRKRIGIEAKMDRHTELKSLGAAGVRWKDQHGRQQVDRRGVSELIKSKPTSKDQDRWNKIKDVEDRLHRTK